MWRMERHVPRGGGNSLKPSHNHGLRLFLRRLAAFTLAEVLITLGIIGVVAALTLPSLIENHKKQVIVSRLNKVYSTLGNAFITAKEHEGEVDSWNLVDYTQSSEYENNVLYYILPYMKTLKICKNERGCFPDISYGSIGTTSYGVNIDRRDYYSKAILNDGVLITALTHRNNCTNEGSPCAAIRVDVNGSNPPNILGIDLHTFLVFKDRIVPAGAVKTLDGSFYENRGDLCTAHVVYEKNLDFIKDKKCEAYK